MLNKKHQSRTQKTTYLTVIICKSLIRLYNLMQISIHQFIHNIHITKVFPIRWPYYILDFNHLHANNTIDIHLKTKILKRNNNHK